MPHRTCLAIAGDVVAKLRFASDCWCALAVRTSNEFETLRQLLLLVNRNATHILHGDLCTSRSAKILDPFD